MRLMTHCIHEEKKLAHNVVTHRYFKIHFTFNKNKCFDGINTCNLQIHRHVEMAVVKLALEHHG